MARSNETMQHSLIPLVKQVPQRVVRIEKNLNSLGFFSPLVRGKEKRREKTVSVTRVLPGGARAEAKATIISPRDLPNTSDLDKYLAFQMIVADIKRRSGSIVNPVGFTTYHLLKLLGVKPVGKRYIEVSDWLKKMSGTHIESEGAVYFAKGKRRASANFHVFDMTVTTGEVFPDGGVADQNYVWLSQWQLENLNSNYVLPIDLEFYRELTAPIAKAMVPLLYQWFYAASRRPVQKRYRELCQLLNIGVHSALSKAKEKLTPALSQLKSIGYLENWDVVRTVDGTDFKLLITPGPIFQKEIDKCIPYRDDAVQSVFKEVVQALVDRKVDEKVARRLLLEIPDDYDPMGTIEWADDIVARGGPIANPPGLYVSFLRDGVRPPMQFVSSKRRAELRKKADEERNQQVMRQAIEAYYHEYREQQITAYIETLCSNLKNKLFRELDKKAAKEYPFLTSEQRAHLVQRMAMKEVEAEVNLISLEEFEARQAGQLSLV